MPDNWRFPSLFHWSLGAEAARQARLIALGNEYLVLVRNIDVRGEIQAWKLR